MRLLRHYQLDIIFLFFGVAAILWLSLYTLAYLGIDPHRAEWWIGGPLLFFYVAHLAHIRRNIPAADRRIMTTKSLVYWISLGCLLFASYATPLPAGDFWSLNALFVIFTLLLADSYWDFKKLTWDNLFNRQA